MSSVVIFKYALAMVTSRYKETYYFTGTVISVTPLQLNKREGSSTQRERGRCMI